MSTLALQGNTAQARACYFDVINKWGAWASLPLSAGHNASPVFGARYSTPTVTAGGMISPTDGQVRCLWLVGNIHSADSRLHSQCYSTTGQPVCMHLPPFLPALLQAGLHLICCDVLYTKASVLALTGNICPPVFVDHTCPESVPFPPHVQLHLTHSRSLLVCIWLNCSHRD